MTYILFLNKYNKHDQKRAVYRKIGTQSPY